MVLYYKTFKGVDFDEALMNFSIYFNIVSSPMVVELRLSRNQMSQYENGLSLKMTHNPK